MAFDRYFHKDKLIIDRLYFKIIMDGIIDETKKAEASPAIPYISTNNVPTPKNIRLEAKPVRIWIPCLEVAVRSLPPRGFMVEKNKERVKNKMT